MPPVQSVNQNAGTVRAPNVNDHVRQTPRTTPHANAPILIDLTDDDNEGVEIPNLEWRPPPPTRTPFRPIGPFGHAKYQYSSQ